MRSLGTLSSQMKETLSLSDGGEGLKFESSALEVQRSTLKACGVEWRVLRCVGRRKKKFQPVNRRNSDVHSDSDRGRCTRAEVKMVLVKSRFPTRFVTFTCWSRIM